MINKKVEERPWGKFERFTYNEPSTVKIITIRQGEELSLQSHESRDEFWRILGGSPPVTIDTEQHMAKVGDEFFISAQTLHRIAAPQDDVTFLEIAFGIFTEDDITRVEDKYGRIKK